jgi:hypothetical protein
MTSLFGNLKSDGLEASTDNLGGGSFTRESDIYSGKIKMAYAGAAKSGARFVQLIVDLPDGKEYKETVYITNKAGENFYLNKSDNSKKVPLPGFTTIDDICLCATGKPLAEQDAEEKIVKIYDFEAKAELPTSVPVLIELLGQDISLAILKVTENKQAKNASGVYEATAETRDINSIDKVFNTATQMTVVEARNKAEAPVFWDNWLERNKGKTRDKTSKVTGNPGAPGAARSGPPQAGAAPARQSLFGKK